MKIKDICYCEPFDQVEEPASIIQPDGTVAKVPIDQMNDSMIPLGDGTWVALDSGDKPSEELQPSDLFDESPGAPGAPPTPGTPKTPGAPTTPGTPKSPSKWMSPKRLKEAKRIAKRKATAGQNTRKSYSDIKKAEVLDHLVSMRNASKNPVDLYEQTAKKFNVPLGNLSRWWSHRDAIWKSAGDKYPQAVVFKNLVGFLPLRFLKPTASDF